LTIAMTGRRKNSSRANPRCWRRWRCANERMLSGANQRWLRSDSSVLRLAGFGTILDGDSRAVRCLKTNAVPSVRRVPRQSSCKTTGAARQLLPRHFRGGDCFSLLSEAAAQERFWLELVADVYAVITFIVAWH
jgi:hypothetical protein